MEEIDVEFAPTYTNNAYDNNGDAGDVEITLRVDKLSGNEQQSVQEPSSNGASSLNGDEDLEMPGELRRDRPYSASMISRKSTASNRSRASLSSTVWTSEYCSKNMFSYRPGMFAKAVEECQRLLFQEEDGEMCGAWLLSEITHWDHEYEKLIILTTNSMFVIKYDFIKLSVRETRRISLNEITNLQIADFVYPSKSLMPGRDHGGVRIHLGETSFLQRWNPWSYSLPSITLTHHLLIYNKNENETVTYNADDFAESLIQQLDLIRRREGKELKVDDSPIMIESYASITSMIHNQSKLGYNLDRNGVNF